MVLEEYSVRGTTRCFEPMVKMKQCSHQLVGSSQPVYIWPFDKHCLALKSNFCSVTD